MFAMPFSVVVGAGLVGFAPSGACVVAGHSALQDGPPVLIDAILAAGPQRLAAQARRAGKSGWAVRKGRGVFFQDGGSHSGRLCRVGWFALRVLFLKIVPVGPIELPVLSSLDPAALVLSVLTAVALFRWRLGVLRTLGVCAAAGAVFGLAGLG